MFNRIIKSVFIIVLIGGLAIESHADEASISSNPAAVNIVTGSGALQRNKVGYFQLNSCS